MKPATLFLAFFAASVQAGIPTPSLTLPTGAPSLGSLTQTSVTPSSSSQVPKCVVNCAASSIASSGSKCTSLQDPCVCSDSKFQDAMSECLKDCTTAEQLAAKGFQKAVCAYLSSSGSATGSGTANASSASQSGSSALAVQIDFTQSGIFALTVAIAGTVMGGFLI